MEVEKPLAADGEYQGEAMDGVEEYGEDGVYYEEGDIDDLPVTQEDAWAVIR